MDSVKTGRLIASIRKRKGMTQQDIADKLHITSKAVSKWERGISFPSIDVLEGLASVLDITVMDLLAGERIQNQDIAQKSSEISVQVLKKEKRTRRMLMAACAAIMLTIIISLLSIWWPAIFQRGNPIPYLIAAAKLNDVQPYVQVGSKEGIFISKRGECPALFEYVESNWNVGFVEQAGSGYIFSNGRAHLVVSSEIYWRNYTVWVVPHHTLEAP